MEGIYKLYINTSLFKEFYVVQSHYCKHQWWQMSYVAYRSRKLHATLHICWSKAMWKKLTFLLYSNCIISWWVYKPAAADASHSKVLNQGRDEFGHTSSYTHLKELCFLVTTSSFFSPLLNPLQISTIPEKSSLPEKSFFKVTHDLHVSKPNAQCPVLLPHLFSLWHNWSLPPL